MSHIAPVYIANKLFLKLNYDNIIVIILVYSVFCYR